MTNAVRRGAAVLSSVAALVLLHGPAFAQEHEAEASAGFPWAGVIAVFAVMVIVPVLFLVATQIRPPGSEDEEIEPVVSGIRQGRAPVPRWLYFVYVLIL